MLQYLLEFLVAMIILVILYYFLFRILFPAAPNYKSTEFNVIPNKSRVDVIRGILPLNSGMLTISTFDPTSPEYVDLPRPSNVTDGKGGFTYSFWMNKNGTTMNGLRNKNIFLRGVNKSVSLNNLYGESNTTQDLLVKMPLLRYPHNNERDTQGNLLEGYELVVEFNTLKKPNNTWYITPQVLSILTGDKWAMYSFIFHDNVDQYGMKRGLQIDFYIDNKLIDSHVIRDDGLRYNDGPLYLLPNVGGTNSSGYLADFRYFNYALGPNDIDSLFAEGYNSGNYVTPKQRRINTLNNNASILSLEAEMSIARGLPETI